MVGPFAMRIDNLIVDFYKTTFKYKSFFMPLSHAVQDIAIGVPKLAIRIIAREIWIFFTILVERSI